VLLIVGISTTGCLGDGFGDIFPKDACDRTPKPRDQAVGLETSAGQLPMFQVHGSLVRSLDDACFSEAQLELRQDDDCELSLSFVSDPEDPTRLVADEVELVASSSVCVTFPENLRGRYAASALSLDSGTIWVSGLPNSETVNTGCHREPLILHLGGEMVGTTIGEGAATTFEFDSSDYELEVPLDASWRDGTCGV